MKQLGCNRLPGMGRAGIGSGDGDGGGGGGVSHRSGEEGAARCPPSRRGWRGGRRPCGTEGTFVFRPNLCFALGRGSPDMSQDTGSAGDGPAGSTAPRNPPSKATQWRELLWEAPRLRLYFKHRLPAEAGLPRASPTPEPVLPPPASPLTSAVPPKAPFPCTAKHGPDGSKVSQISPYGIFSHHDPQPVLGAAAAVPHTVTRSRGRGRCCLRLKEPGRDSWGHGHRFTQGRGVGNAWLLPNPAQV